jgi:hypothetical protein
MSKFAIFRAWRYRLLERRMPSRLLPAIGTAALVVLAISITPATAVTFNFNALADNGINTTGGNPANGVGEGFWDSKAALSAGYTVGGITVNASAQGTANSRAYLDDPDGGHAGLGVCSLAACAGNSDDNTGRAGDVNGGALEKLVLKFNTAVTFVSAIFGDRDHNLLGTSTVRGEFTINGIAVHTIGGNIIAADLALLVALGPLTELDFQSTGNDYNRANHDFYLSSLNVIGTGGGNQGETPLPAALPLFASGGGLLGFLGWRRKRKQAAVV